MTLGRWSQRAAGVTSSQPARPVVSDKEQVSNGESARWARGRLPKRTIRCGQERPLRGGSISRGSPERQSQRGDTSRKTAT